MCGLLLNLHNLKTTTLGTIRIQKNLNLPLNTDVVTYCKDQIKASDNIVRKGKNWYVRVDDVVITVNAFSFTIITAHRVKNK